MKCELVGARKTDSKQRSRIIIKWKTNTTLLGLFQHSTDKS
jgi:hypothetical protein